MPQLRKFIVVLSVVVLFGISQLTSNIGKVDASFGAFETSMSVGTAKDNENLSITISCKNYYPDAGIPDSYATVQVTNSSKGGVLAYGSVSTSLSYFSSPVTIKGGIKSLGTIQPFQTRSGTLSLAPVSVSAGDTVSLSARCVSKDGSAGSSAVVRSVTVQAGKTPEQIAAEKKAAEEAARAAEVEKQLQKIEDEFASAEVGTPDLSKVKEKEAKDYEGLNLTSKNYGSITYTKNINLLSDGLTKNAGKIDKAVKFGAGTVEVDSKRFPDLNLPAKVVFTNIELKGEEINIYKDGELEESVSKIVVYDPEKKTVSFDVEGFSKYDIGPGLSVEGKLEEGKYTLNIGISYLAETVKIMRNGEELETVKEIGEDGMVSREYELEEGENVFRVEATGQNGITESEEISAESAPFPVFLVAIAVVVILMMLVAAGLATFFLMKKKGKSKKKDSKEDKK